jgi:hypothetical protein
MTQDIDVARVAAALRAPVIRYRNFGNVPVRGTFQPPPAEIPVESPGLDAALAEAVALQQQEEARALAAPVPHAHQSAGRDLTGPSLLRPEPLNQPQVDRIDIAATTWTEAVPLTVTMQPDVVAPVAALKGPVVDLPPGETILSVSRAEAFQATKPLPAAPMVLEGAFTSEDARPLLDVLREASLQPAPAQQGLLGLLAQPAIWDRPASQPPAMVPGPLSGQPIATDAGGLLSSAGFGAPAPAAYQPPASPVSQHQAPQPDFVPYQEVPPPDASQQNFVPYQEPAQPSAPQPDFMPFPEAPQPYALQQNFVPHQEPMQPFVPQQNFAPYREAPQPYAPQQDFVPYQVPAQPSVPQPDFVPFQQPSYALQPEAQVQPPPQPSSAQVKPPAASLADVFRKVRAPAAQPAEAKQNAALHNVLRGLRAGRQD